jgi:AraC-like DNA-binding protein
MVTVTADLARSDLGGVMVHRIRKSGDPEEFAEQISTYSPGVDVSTVSTAPFNASAKAGRTSRMCLFNVELAQARVRLVSPGSYVSVSMPLDRSVRYEEKGKSWGIDIGEAFILRPDSEFNVQIAEKHRSLVLNMSRNLVEQTMRELRGQPESGLGNIGSYLSLKSAEGASFFRQASFYWSELLRSSSVWKSHQLTEHAENALVCAFVLALEEGNSVKDSKQGTMTRNRVHLARDFIHARPDRPLTLAEIAAHTGASARTLTRAFQAEFGVGPVGYHRQCRLEHARLDLAASDSAKTTVTAVAMKYGFCQLSHFAAAYKAMFGENPSDTLLT